MTASLNPSTLKLMLVDEDPVFRMGLRIWLEQSAGFQVVAEASTGQQALALLAQRPEPSEAPGSIGAPPPTPPTAPPLRPDLDLVIVDLGLGDGHPDDLPGFQLCADIKRLYPTLPVLVLSAETAPLLRAAARQVGADGFGQRGMPVRDLAQLIRRVSGADAATPDSSSLAGEASPPAPPSIPGPLTSARISLRVSALQQIEAQLIATTAERRQVRGSSLYDAVLAGRQRELRAARWVIKRLLATPQFSDQWTATTPPPEPNFDWEQGWDPAESRATVGEGPTGAAEPIRVGGEPPRIPPVPQPGPVTDAAGALALTYEDRLSLRNRDVQSVVFEGVFRKLQGSLENASPIPLEIDILRPEKKRELCYLILRQLEDILTDLRQANLRPGQLGEKSPQIVFDVWQGVVTDFFGRYYTLEVGNLEQPVVPVLLEESLTVQQEVLNRIPQVPMLLAHLLFQESILVDGGAYVATTPEALSRSQELLENLLIQLANGVIQPLLNRFADVERLKKYLYQRRLMSSRDIERFRNDLAWRYRWDVWVNIPKAIFESQHRLFVLTESGIQTRYVYAPRQEELDALSGLQLSVTLAIEARDAISPRLRSVISLVGSGLVYVLTDVVGRGIGLVGRGILKGIGNAWNDPRFRRRSRDEEAS